MIHIHYTGIIWFLINGVLNKRLLSIFNLLAIFFILNNTARFTIPHIIKHLVLYTNTCMTHNLEHYTWLSTMRPILLLIIYIILMKIHNFCYILQKQIILQYTILIYRYLNIFMPS